MPSQKLFDTVIARVEREMSRTGYPEDFPALPKIPAARYCDQAYFDLEIEHVFRKSWLRAAHVSQFPEQGSYRLFEELGQNVIISRGTDDVIRAYRNACQHRGSAVLLEPEGKARRFVCPYHAWGYNLDGQLTSVPDARDFKCLNKADIRLPSVRCEIWQGFIYINFDDKAQPLSEYMKPIDDSFGEFPFADMDVKRSDIVEVNCNWKVAYDNFLEIYHVRTVHRDTIAPWLETDSFAPSLLTNGHACFATKKKGETIYANLESDGFKVDEGFHSHTIAVIQFPNGEAPIDPAGVLWMNFWPVAPNKVRIQATQIGPVMATAAGEVAFRAQYKEIIDQILSEDMPLFEGIQRAMENGDLPELTLGYQEQCIYWYQEELDRNIGHERVPPHLRLQPVLGSYLGR